MQKNSLWLVAVVLLLGLLFLREPKLERNENLFLSWLLKNSRPHGPAAPLTVVEIGSDPLVVPDSEMPASSGSRVAELGKVTPLEFALFLQSVLDFKPTVVAFENILHWRQRDKDQEQVFLDQAMHVPRLLVASELTANPDPDAATAEIPTFTQVTGKRGDLVEFSGIDRQPAEDVRLISTAGFVNLPDESFDGIHVPLLFRYRGEVIPSFTLQAIMLWLRLTPTEVKIVLGSRIEFPDGRKVPITNDGAVLIAPNEARKAHRIGLNDLLLAAQKHDTGKETSPEFNALENDIILARVPANPLSPPDVFAAAIATIQNSAYVHRISWVFDCVVLVVVGLLGSRTRKFLRIDLVLGGIAFTAIYCLIALGVVERWDIWLPGILPLGAVWLLILISMSMHRKVGPRAVSTMLPPPLA